MNDKTEERDDLPTEYDIGYEHASALIFEYGNFMAFQEPYPEIDQDQIEFMKECGIHNIDIDTYWKGFNCRVNKDVNHK